MPPPRRSTEEALAALAEVRGRPVDSSSVEELRRELGNRSSHVVAKAAAAIAALEVEELKPDLVAAFERMMHTPEKTDPGCAAKTAIVSALDRLDHDDPDLFLRGIRHVQMEPVWGRQIDAAAELRAVCAIAIARMGYADALTELADCLADPEPPVRSAAARAVAVHGHPHGLPLLRLRALIPEADPEVLSDCLTALLDLDEDERTLRFVAGFLDAPRPEAQEAAALALGESRAAQAFDLLRSWWEHTTDHQLRGTALLAIAMLRRESALDFLVSLVAEGALTDALQAIAALRIHRVDETLRQRVVQAASKRAEPRLDAAVAEAFPDEG